MVERLATDYDSDFSHSEAYVICNPVSSNIGSATHRIRGLQTHFNTFEKVETIDDTRQANIDRVTEHLLKLPDEQRKDTLVVAVGGDGTAGMVGQALTQPDFPELHNIPMLVIAAGKINDVAHMMHSRRGRRHPTALLPAAQIKTVRPLISTVQSPDHSRQLFGIGYITAGLSGRGAEDIGNTRIPVEKRNRLTEMQRLAKIGSLIVRDCMQAQTFGIKEFGSSRRLERVDIMASNGPRMAGSLRTPARLEDDTYFLTHTSSSRMRHILATGIRLLCNQQPGDMRQHPYVFEALRSTTIQVDGEAFGVPASSLVTIGQAEQALKLVSLGK
jgi:diacylglycerol kinase family enzyme